MQREQTRQMTMRMSGIYCPSYAYWVCSADLQVPFAEFALRLFETLAGQPLS